MTLYGLHIIDRGIAPTFVHADASNADANADTSGDSSTKRRPRAAGSCSIKFKCYIWWIVFVLLSCGVTYMTILNTIIPFGALGTLSYLFIIIVTFVAQGSCCTCTAASGANSCCKRQEIGNSIPLAGAAGAAGAAIISIITLRTIGLAAMITGLVVQVILAPACDDRGYEKNCFQDCPLLDPTVFNHNALFHLIYMFGLIFLAVGEQISISISIDGGGGGRGGKEKTEIPANNTEGGEKIQMETAQNNNEETFLDNPC